MEEKKKSIKSLMSKSFGLKYLPADLANRITEELLYHMKNVVSYANVVKRKSGCSILTLSHLDIAMKRNDFPPQYGFCCDQNNPFGYTSGGGCDLSFIKETEVDLKEFVNEFKDLKKPLEMELHSHWLAVEGVQPTIPENCSELKMETVDPMNKTLNEVNKLLGTRTISVEQQIYFNEITRSCITDRDKGKQTAAIKSISLDREVYLIAPQLCIFIKEGIRVNVKQGNLAVLNNLMKMADALVRNIFVNLNNYLHHLLPSVITCLVSNQLCAQPLEDNHFALRDLSSNVLKAICKNYNNSINNIQTRLTKYFCRHLSSLADTSLVSLYGVLKGLESLGPQVIQLIILPKIKDIGERIKDSLEDLNASNLDRMEANHIKNLVLRLLIPISDLTLNCTDYEVFGYLGCDIEYQMKNAKADSSIVFMDH